MLVRHILGTNTILNPSVDNSTFPANCTSQLMLISDSQWDIALDVVMYSPSRQSTIKIYDERIDSLHLVETIMGTQYNMPTIMCHSGTAIIVFQTGSDDAGGNFTITATTSMDSIVRGTPMRNGSVHTLSCNEMLLDPSGLAPYNNDTTESRWQAVMRPSLPFNGRTLLHGKCSIAEDDTLAIFDGPNTSSPLLACYSGITAISNIDLSCTSEQICILLIRHTPRHEWIKQPGFYLQMGYALANETFTTAVDSTTWRFSWDATTEGPWTVRYWTQENNYLIREIECLTTRATLTDLPANTYLFVQIKNHSCGTSPTYTFLLPPLCHTEAYDCINAADLLTCHVKATTGSFTNPYVLAGVVNLGQYSPSSKHTVCTDTTQRDRRTGNQLRVVPPGESYSVRLGSWQTGSTGSSISYQYVVDTMAYDMLSLSYAAVMQDPNHSPDQQPHFTFEITDLQGRQLNPECYSANFIASRNLGCNTAADEVLWKDWTTVMIDLTPLQGQVIYIKLTAYNCLPGGHYGSAYFSLKCGSKQMQSLSCGESNDNVFIAPAGMTYKWYPQSQPDRILSTARTLSVRDTQTYCCDISYAQTANHNCFFTLRAKAGPRFPYARFEPQLRNSDSCRSVYLFVNQSVITRDYEHHHLTDFECESFMWDFGDGTTSTEVSPAHVYRDTGLYTIRLIAMLGNGACADTTVQRLRVRSTCPFDTTICPDKFPFQWGPHFFTSTGIQYDTLINQFGGDSIVGWRLRTFEKQVQRIYDTINRRQLPYMHAGRWYDTTITNDTLFYPMGSQHRCDSTAIYSLYVMPDAMYIRDSFVCDNQLPMHWQDLTITDSGTYSKNYRGRFGQDSTFVINVSVKHPYYTDIDTSLCNGEVLQFHGYTFETDSTHYVPYSLYRFCDSIYRIRLHINHTYNIDTTVHMCEGDIYYVVNGETLTNDSAYLLQLQSNHGCDSTVLLHLNIHPHRTTSDTRYICAEEVLHYHDTTLSGFGLHTVVLHTRYGCDSTIMLQLSNASTHKATLKAEPPMASYEWHEIRLSDASRGATRSQWYIDSSYVGDETILFYDYPVEQDSVLVMLISMGSPGCYDTSYTYIVMERGICWVPNAFTPKESTNRQFCIGWNDLLEATMTIYTRQGQYITSYDALHECWDGTKDGYSLPQGAYFYLLRYTTHSRPQSPFVKRGTVLLLR